ncbi:MAG: mechanosensitive ion channel family protein [Dongiaceae bacterium]
MSATTEGASPLEAVSAGDFASQRLDAIRMHLRGLIEAVPEVPGGLRNALSTVYAEASAAGWARVLFLVGALLIVGIGLELAYRLYHRPYDVSDETWQKSGLWERLKILGLALLGQLTPVLLFAVGSTSTFLVLTWPPILRRIAVGYLIAVVALRVMLAIGRALLAPHVADVDKNFRCRIVPIDQRASFYWHHRFAELVGWFAFGLISIELLVRLGVKMEVRHLVAYFLALGLLVIGIDIAWRRPRSNALASAQAASTVTQSWLLTLYFLLLWVLFVVNMYRVFWLAVVLFVVPISIRVSRRAILHLAAAAPEHASTAASAISVACLSRGVQALLIIGGVLVLAHGWHVDIGVVAEQNTVAMRLLRGALSAIVLALLGDFIWQVVKSVIDDKIKNARTIDETANPEELRRKARLRTLLPILRNVLWIVFVVIVALMALAALGVEIGPLIAGAGVVGVAVGFGAQTLVKDIISGMFYLLDDAFRVGEYIQSGSYKGTVESFSLRSVKLRHHRGPLYTVPFGELGAVQNMSRDWVIDKMRVTVTYDADLAKAKKIIKQIGKDLAADPEFGRHILEPLKMQGVEQLGANGIEIRMKLMTKPGEQFTIRRRAYAQIREAFHAAGIHFAVPTVRVAGGGDEEDAVAASRILEEQAKAAK